MGRCDALIDDVVVIPVVDHQNAAGLDHLGEIPQRLSENPRKIHDLDPV